jgi:hypothetical protein
MACKAELNDFQGAYAADKFSVSRLKPNGDLLVFCLPR